MISLTFTSNWFYSWILKYIWLYWKTSVW